MFLFQRSLHACHTKINNLNATILNLRNQKMVKTDVDHYKPYTNKKLTNTLSRRDEEGEYTLNMNYLQLDEGLQKQRNFGGDLSEVINVSKVAKRPCQSSSRD